MSGGTGGLGSLDFEQELSAALGQNEFNILKPTIKESQLLYQNAKYYYSVNEFVGALVSYSCASVLINSTITQLQTSLDIISDSNDQATIQTIIDKANNILECCLESVEELQQKVSVSSSGEKKNETKEKWAKRCLNIQPLVLSGKSCIYYDDVVGLYKEKAQINAAFISPLMYPNLFPKTSKGILLFGPPGTGKTLLVKAAVNELQKKGDKQVGVFYFAPSPADLKGKYVGETEKKIEEWFTCASYAACQSELNKDCKPKKFISIIFIDEMDSIAGDRSNDPTGLNSNSVNTLLQMMDGISSKENVAVIGVTNYPWTLDSAIIRRFDTQILVGLPKIPEVQELLDYEMNSSLNLKKKISNFCENTTFDKEETSDNHEKAISCGVACTDNSPAEKLILGEFYKKFIIEYYNDNNIIDPNRLSQVKGIVLKLYNDGFTNSDIARFFRTALRHTGELTIETSLFYNTGLVGDTEKPEKYMSAVTQMSNEKKGIELSIKILNDLIIPSDKSSVPVYHDKPPEISVIEFDGYYYYNIKCILCKDNDMLLNHRLLRGIYIRGNKLGEDFDEKIYKDAFFKTKGYAEAAVDAIPKAVSNIKSQAGPILKTATETVVANLAKTRLRAAVGAVGSVGAVALAVGPAAIGTAVSTAAGASAAIGILGITFSGSKADYIARFLAQSADDLVGGANKDIIIEFDVNFEKIDKAIVPNTSIQTLISKSNVWCFFDSFMKKYNTIYKNNSETEAIEVLTKYQNAAIDDGAGNKIPIFTDSTEKTNFITLKDSDSNDFYVAAPSSTPTPNNNLVAKFLKAKFLDDYFEFTQCFKKLDKGEYYSLYNYLLLLNLFTDEANSKITNIGKQYFNKGILKIVDPANDKPEKFIVDEECPIFGSADKIKLKFKERTEAEVKEDGPRDIIISVEDYIKIIPYYDNYNEASGTKTSDFDKTQNLIMDFSVFITLFRRTVFINGVAKDDSLKTIELEDPKNKDTHFTYCLIQLYMNGVYKNAINYNNLIDYNNSTYVLMKFIEIFFNENGIIKTPTKPKTAPPPKTQEEILDEALTEISRQIVAAQQIKVDTLADQSALVSGTSQNVMDLAQLSVDQATAIETVLKGVETTITNLKTSGKALNEITTNLGTEKTNLATAKNALDNAKTTGVPPQKIQDPEKAALKVPLDDAIAALTTAEDEIQKLQTASLAASSAAPPVVASLIITSTVPKPAVNDPVDDILAYLKSTKEFTDDTDTTDNDLAQNFTMLFNYVKLFYEYYLGLYSRPDPTDLSKFRFLFFDNLDTKHYYNVVKDKFKSDTVLKTGGFVSGSWNTQLTNAVNKKNFDSFHTIIVDGSVQKQFGITPKLKMGGGGLTIKDPAELNAIFNGLFDNIYLEYYGNVNGCLHPATADTIFTNYTEFATVFDREITNKTSTDKTKAIIKYYDEQIRFINSDNTTNGEIKKKRIFIASEFNFLRIQQLIKSNIFSSLWTGSKGLYAYVKSFFVTTATYSTEDEQKKNILEMLDELKNKNLLLSTIFKDVRAFGFQKIGNEIGNEIENDDYSSTSSNSVRKIEWSYLANYSSPDIKGDKYDKSKYVVSSTERGVKKLTKNILNANPEAVNLLIAHVSQLISPFRIYQWIAGLLLQIVIKFFPSFAGYEHYVMNAMYTFLAAAGGISAVYSGAGAGALAGVVGTGVFGFAIGSTAVGGGLAMGVAGLAAMLGNFWTQDMTTMFSATNIINQFSSFFTNASEPGNINTSGTFITSFTSVFSFMFEGIKKLLVMLTPNWSTDQKQTNGVCTQISNVISEGLTKMNITSIDFTSISSTVSGYFETTETFLKGLKLSTTAKIAFILTIGQIYSFYSRNLDDEAMINNNFLYQMFNIITLSGKIKVDSFNKSPNDAILSYIKDEMKRNSSLGILSYMYNVPYDTLIMGETKNKNTYDLILFNKKMHNNVSPYSLVNLNIPISSFIYAFNEVKPTADKDLTKQLDKYYENKDAFMEERKKKLEGKK